MLEYNIKSLPETSILIDKDSYIITNNIARLFKLHIESNNKNSKSQNKENSSYITDTSLEKLERLYSIVKSEQSLTRERIGSNKEQYNNGNALQEDLTWLSIAYGTLSAKVNSDQPTSERKEILTDSKAYIRGTLEILTINSSTEVRVQTEDILRNLRISGLNSALNFEIGSSAGLLSLL